jgi:hypothetical protein
MLGQHLPSAWKSALVSDLLIPSMPAPRLHDCRIRRKNFTAVALRQSWKYLQSLDFETYPEIPLGLDRPFEGLLA